MSSSTWIKEEAEPITEEDLFPSRTIEDTAPYAWLDPPADSDSKPEEDVDIDIDVNIDIDNVPTLYDIIEQPIITHQSGHDDAPMDDEDVFWDPSDDMPEVPPSLASSTDVDSEVPVNAEESWLEQHTNAVAAYADQDGGSSQATPQSLEDVFNLARYEPAQLQKGLLVLACTFQVIAVAALWRAIGDRVIATALVPPAVYSSIGVAAYLLGMRYLRIHFAQVRVGDKDWLLCEQVMVAADNGVMLKARFGTAYLIWEQLLGVAQDNDYYYLLIEPSQGFKVPKKGVSDPVLKVKFEDLASLTKAQALQGF